MVKYQPRLFCGESLQQLFLIRAIPARAGNLFAAHTNEVHSQQNQAPGKATGPGPAYKYVYPLLPVPCNAG
jgi:hypothetical protein